MAIFYDLPVDHNEKIDVYAILRMQFLCAAKKKHQLQERLAHMTDPGQVRFYKKRVKYTPRGQAISRVYEYNCHYLRYAKKVRDNKGREKVRHFTRFLTNKEYSEIKREAVLYRYLSDSLKYITNLIDTTRKFILSSFYHHPDDIPDFEEEEINVYKEFDRASSCRQWHLEHRATFTPEKYKCVDGAEHLFMSRGELLLHDAFLHCGLTPQYETALEVNDIAGLPPKLYYPDFKCNCGGKTYYFEYFGMMNDPAYFKDACKKMEAYMRYGIIPGHNFIAFCSGDSSAIHMKPVVRTLEHIAAGRDLLQKNNIAKLPGIVRLDSLDRWKLPNQLVKLIVEKSLKFIPKKHKFKSSSNRSLINQNFEKCKK